MSKSVYLDLMESALSAYSVEHIDRYYNEVKRDGLKEHGFPRLAANIGILMAHGRRHDLKERFIKMMDLCCDQFLKVKAANDFSVKEVVFCLQELETVDVIGKEVMQGWKNQLAQIDPYKCYNVYATAREDVVHNWAAFTMVSEYMRQSWGLTDKYRDFIDLQAYSQLRHLDENKMYRDPNEPMVYDLVTRGLFAILLHQGYDGEYRQIWQDALDESALLTLKMQSVSGEIAFGGRSNQFIHNESHLVIMLEYYAGRYAAKGDMVTAGKFKAAALRAIENMQYWLARRPICHVKNSFPRESKYGCEDYAYFDKYMITAASFIYVAYRICDEKIPVGNMDDVNGMTWQSSDNFHKLFMKAGEYFAEYDYRADYHYDCSGMGRLHRKGAPSEICLSTPCPVNPSYYLDIDQPSLLSIAPGVRIDGEWHYATAKEVRHIVKSHQASGESASASVDCIFGENNAITANYHLDRNGMEIRIAGRPGDEVCCLLPVFRFNGRDKTLVKQGENTLEVIYEGWRCRYTVEGGTVTDLKKPARNRNGHYDTFAAAGKEKVTVRISIEKL